MENVELMKDRCQNFSLHLFELSAVFLFCSSSRVRAPICFIAFFRRRKEKPALIHQTLSNFVLLLFFVSANCPRLFGIKNNSLNSQKQCSNLGTYKKKLFQTFWAQLRVRVDFCQVYHNAIELYSQLGCRRSSCPVFLNSTFLWSLDSLL